MRFTVANMTQITQTEIRQAFGPTDFLTNVGGFLGLYVGCSMISIFEVFYFAFMILQQKLTNRRNQILPTEVQKEENESKFKKNCKQKKGLTLVEIFDL